MAVVIDSSALVKLLVAEWESDALRSYLIDKAPIVINRVALVEAARAVRQVQTDEPVPLEGVVGVLAVRELDGALVDRAAALDEPGIGTIDAIVLATALELRAEIDGLVTYDPRQADAARRLGLTVIAPGQ